MSRRFAELRNQESIDSLATLCALLLPAMLNDSIESLRNDRSLPVNVYITPLPRVVPRLKQSKVETLATRPWDQLSMPSVPGLGWPGLGWTGPGPSETGTAFRFA